MWTRGFGAGEGYTEVKRAVGLGDWGQGYELPSQEIMESPTLGWTSAILGKPLHVPALRALYWCPYCISDETEVQRG